MLARDPEPGSAHSSVATVGGQPVSLDELDRRERELRSSAALAGVLPAAGTSEGRQLRRWLTQLLVTERVIEIEAAGRGVTAPAPGADEVLPDATARLEIGSVASAVLSASTLARALFAELTMAVDVTEDEVRGYHARNPYRFAPARRGAGGWHEPPQQPPLAQVRARIVDELRGAARRRAFATWLDGRRAELVRLEPGYEHPGDPRQPDNTHKH
jgi:[acyl-carrier-protein] S-malonyltransferase